MLITNEDDKGTWGHGAKGGKVAAEKAATLHHATGSWSVDKITQVPTKDVSLP